MLDDKHGGNVLIFKCLQQNGSAYRCFCSADRLKSVRERSAKAGKPMAYDRHCLSLSPEEVEKKMEAKEPYTIRLNVSCRAGVRYSRDTM